MLILRISDTLAGMDLGYLIIQIKFVYVWTEKKKWEWMRVPINTAVLMYIKGEARSYFSPEQAWLRWKLLSNKHSP